LAQHAVIVPQPAQRITGEAALKISLEGFPRGTRTALSQAGSLSQEISVDRKQLWITFRRASFVV
jgi:hypothetical protein